jgi:hypothetical protein
MYSTLIFLSFRVGIEIFNCLNNRVTFELLYFIFLRNKSSLIEKFTEISFEMAENHPNKYLI